jgi:hypothetical protein
VLEQASFITQGHNPDVLTCIANLSNDEVFTPPEFAAQMLDTLEQAWADANDGANIWADKSATFFDPFTKSGVFLREIARRLTEGLVEEIPDLEERVDHILTKQVYGIGITELTSLLARRSLYCSKYANGPHSIAKSFTTEAGNIWFERTEHTWVGGKKEFVADTMTGREVEVMVNRKCQYCGAGETEYGRGEGSETHAYGLIHTDDVVAWLANTFGENMQFDVIIGNPPYQLNDGGGVGSSAMPIYQMFVEQAKALEPRQLVMVTPSRWFTGGRGLNGFRDRMLNDSRLREIHDFLNASEVFPGVEIKGGVSYFIWEREREGICRVATYSDGKIRSVAERPLLEKGVDTFIRHNELIPILHKIRALGEDTFDELVSANDPFGFDVRETNSYRRVKPDLQSKIFPNSVGIYYFGWRKDGLGYIKNGDISKGRDLIDGHKLFIPKAWGVGNPKTDWVTPFYGEPGTASTETYLTVGPFSGKKEAENALSYMQTRFFHALVSVIKITQNTMKNVYKFAPIQDFSRAWLDKDLYEKYNITEEEIEFIESMIRPMDLSDE